MSYKSYIIHAGAVSFARLFSVLWLFFAPIMVANAAIHACKQADGSVTFQDNACAVFVKDSTKITKVSTKLPFGVDKTWFDRPPVVPDRAVCTKSGCHCGMYSRDFKNNLNLAVADAMYLDGSWHRLESTLAQLDLATDNIIEKADLAKQRDEAACNILMSQKTLRMYGEKVLHELLGKKRYAEDRGLDNIDDCDAGDEIVCQYTDYITIYNRIQGDIKSLRKNSRIQSGNDRIESAESKF